MYVYAGISHQADGVNERDRSNTKQALISAYNTVLAPTVNAACITLDNKKSWMKTTVVGRTINPRQYIKNSILTWLSQFSILLQRSLKERRHESFNSLRVSQVIAAALLAGIMWWHSDFRDIQDRLGLIYFISIFWGVFPSFNSFFAFLQE